MGKSEDQPARSDPDAAAATNRALDLFPATEQTTQEIGPKRDHLVRDVAVPIHIQQLREAG
jgi:hypothetical protein